VEIMMRRQGRGAAVRVPVRPAFLPQERRPGRARAV